MANSFIPYQDPGTTSRKLDSESLTIGANDVERERVQIAGAAAAEISAVKNTAPSSTQYGVIVRPAVQSDPVADSFAASGARTAIDCTNYTHALITVRGTYSATITFEASPNASNYFSVIGSRIDSSALELTSGALVNVTRGWLVNVTGMNRVRINCTSYTSGTVNSTLTPIYSPMAQNPNVSLAAGSNLLGIVETKALPDATGTYCPTGSDSTALEKSRIAKASAGVLYGFSGYQSAQTRWAQVFNATSVPSNGAVPVHSIKCTPDAPFAFQEPSPYGKFFSTGIVIASSTTNTTLTLDTTNRCLFSLLYK